MWCWLHALAQWEKWNYSSDWKTADVLAPSTTLSCKWYGWHISDIFFFRPRYLRSTPHPNFPAPTHHHNTSLASRCSRSQPSQLKNYVTLRYAPQSNKFYYTSVRVRIMHNQALFTNAFNIFNKKTHLRLRNYCTLRYYTPLFPPTPAYAPLAHFPFKTEPQ